MQCGVELHSSLTLARPSQTATKNLQTGGATDCHRLPRGWTADCGPPSPTVGVDAQTDPLTDLESLAGSDDDDGGRISADNGEAGPSLHASAYTRPHVTRTNHGGAARQPPVAKRPARPATPLAARGTQPAQAAPPSVARSATTSGLLAPPVLDPCAHSPARTRGDFAGGSGGMGPHTPTPTRVHLTTNDASSPLGPSDTHASAHAPPPSPPMARQRQHTTPPPIASPRDNAGGSDSAAPRARASIPPRLMASGAPSVLGPLDVRVGGHMHPPSPHTAHQQGQHTTPPPMASPRAARVPHITGIDPSSMERAVRPPDDAPDDDSANPAPTGADPPSADNDTFPAPARAVPPSDEQISSFLLHVRHQATEDATAAAASAVAVPAVPLSPGVTAGDAMSTAASPVDTGLGVGTYPTHIDTAPPAVDGTTAATCGATPIVAIATAVTGVTKRKRRIKHNHAAQDARKSQRRRLLATQDGTPGKGTGSGSRRPSDT